MPVILVNYKRQKQRFRRKRNFKCEIVNRLNAETCKCKDPSHCSVESKNARVFTQEKVRL